MFKIPSLTNRVLSPHDVNVVYRPGHCGQSGDISDGDDSGDGVAMCVDSLSPVSDVPGLIVSPRITLSLVIIMGTGLITPDHHPTRITNDRIMHVFGLINTKPTIKRTLNRKFMSLFIIYRLSNELISNLEFI